MSLWVCWVWICHSQALGNHKMVSGLLMPLEHLGGKMKKKDMVSNQAIQDSNRKCTAGLAYATKCIIIQTTK